MIVPFGAMTGFSIAWAELMVATYYKMRPRTLRRADPRHGPEVAEARQALHWFLTQHHNLTPTVAARLMRARGHKVTPETVRDGAAKHAARLEEFKATSGAKL